ncbi:UNVERIFIED_CONTAM: hypothetical protein Scaly_0822300 [Sesamum calycinum]|uniref:Disease resistance N-terminal domain-containing protein n=1 Tax=Sesamum calycinum TaxID=2727403 RepID=A0AAW2RA29_9LAMI
MIQDFLDDAEMQQITNKAVKRWLKKLEAVAYDADDVLDELNYKVLRRKIKKSKQKVQTFFSRSNSVAFRRKMAQKIKSINEKLELINQEATGYFMIQFFPCICALRVNLNTGFSIVIQNEELHYFEILMNVETESNVALVSVGVTVPEIGEIGRNRVLAREGLHRAITVFRSIL